MIASTISVDSTVKQLRDMFDLANKTFYNDELIQPEINICVLQGNQHSRYVYHCYESFNKKMVSEFSIDRDYVFTGNEENVFIEILRCCVLYYCDTRGIKCTSNNNMYFNNMFKKIAENHGLRNTGRTKYGYTKFALSEDSYKIIYSGQFAFTISGSTYTYGNTYGCSNNHHRGYVCPVCGNIVRSTKPVNIICADCNKRMIERTRRV